MGLLHTEKCVAYCVPEGTVTNDNAFDQVLFLILSALTCSQSCFEFAAISIAYNLLHSQLSCVMLIHAQLVE